MSSTYIEIAPASQTTIVGSVEIVNDVGNPIPVNAIDLDVRDLAFATDKVDVSGSSITFTATDLDIRDLTFATDKVDASGSTIALDAPTLAALENITVSATDLDIRDLNFAQDSVDTSGSVIALDAPTLAALENVTVSATDLDIRDLTFASDKVDASGSTLGANSGTDIGDVTINNAAGVAAVNIQDGGNSITVDASSLPLPTGASTAALQLPDNHQVTVSNFPATQLVSAVSLPLPTGAATSALQTQPGVDIGDVTVNNASGASAVNIQDGGNSITVDGTIAFSNTTIEVTNTGTFAVQSTPATLATATLTNVSGSATSVQLLASTAGRKMATFFNDSSSTMYLKFGTTASTTSYTVLMRPFDYYEIPAPTYTGRIDAIWDSATGAVRITELT